VEQVAFFDVLTSAQPRFTHATPIKGVLEASFDEFCSAFRCKRHIAPFYRSRLKSCMLILQSRRCGYAAESQAKVEEGVLLAGAGSQMA
jgi:hypothetical protein